MSSPPASPYSHTLAKTWDERANSDLFSLRDHLRHLQEERRQNADQTLALAELDEIIDRRIEARFRKMAEIEAPRPLLQRKADVVYLIFFVTHLPVMFLVDLYPLYPQAVKSAIPLLDQIRGYYIATYKDQNFVNPTAWFKMYMYMETLYHVPLSLWAIQALLRDDPRVPLQLLIFALQCSITTVTCIAEYLSWTQLTSEEKMSLGTLYVPYLALGIFMAVDMYGRLERQLFGGKGGLTAQRDEKKLS